MVGVLSLAGAVYFASQLWAKPSPAGAPPQTRVAILNLRLVIKQYDRYKQFIEAIRKEEAGYIEAMKKKQKQADELGTQADGLPAAAREAREQEIRSLQRELENLKDKARKEVSEKSTREMVTVYKLVREAATRYAKANNIDLVLHYEGAIEKDEVDSPALVLRNLNAGGCTPLHWDPSLDITAPIIEALNTDFKREGK
jgi:Skp family chaperone for outer membrane proteins